MVKELDHHDLIMAVDGLSASRTCLEIQSAKTLCLISMVISSSSVICCASSTGISFSCYTLSPESQLIILQHWQDHSEVPCQTSLYSPWWTNSSDHGNQPIGDGRLSRNISIINFWLGSGRPFGSIQPRTPWCSRDSLVSLRLQGQECSFLLLGRVPKLRWTCEPSSQLHC